MLPIAPLMIEHRLIEKMIRLMAQETARIRENVAVSPQFAFLDVKFIDAAVDFIRTYADQVHHGKEEDIFFAALKKKSLSPEHLQIMQELYQDHEWGRKTTARLVEAKGKFMEGSSEPLTDIIECLAALVEFYPRHIAKEDQQFFLPSMEYFSQEEKNAILANMVEFDRGFIQGKYQKILAEWESAGCKCHL